MTFTLDMARRALEIFEHIIEEKKEYLTDLDSAIGDADHGINMNRGMKRAMEKVASKSYNDFGGLFRDVSMNIMSAVGGSAGPLYGTFFMKLAQKLSGQSKIEPTLLAAALEEGLNGIMTLGKSSPGDKTMIDALAPAIEAFKSALAANDPAPWDRALEAAEAGMTATIPMLSRRGRSSYLGERSIGHQDPGATSICYLIAAFRDASREA